MRLEGKAALITGGASGIGAATARRLAAEGARVAIADVDLSGAREVAGELDGAAVEMDVADAASVRAGVALAAEAVGPADVLVNNAGTDRFGWFSQTDEEIWDLVLDVNLRGVLAVTHAALPSMHERGGGASLNGATGGGPGGAPGGGGPN